VIEPQLRVLGLLFGSLKEVLERTLVEAAKSKGPDGLAWLERYESEIIFLAKRRTLKGCLSMTRPKTSVASLAYFNLSSRLPAGTLLRVPTTIEP
jgi:hypothetical protein